MGDSIGMSLMWSANSFGAQGTSTIESTRGIVDLSPMSGSTKKFEAAIRSAIADVCSTGRFEEWKSARLGTRESMGVRFNSSFLFRESVKTKKSNMYLSLSRGGGVGVSQSSSFDGAFSELRESDEEHVTPLSEAIAAELDSLGTILFALISELHDDVLCEEEVKAAALKVLVWNPAAKVPTRDGHRIEVAQVADRALLYATVSGLLGHDLSDDLRAKLDDARIRLLERASFRGQLPSKRGEGGLLHSMGETISSQAKEHLAHFQEWKSKDFDEESATYVELLRTAYNFTSEAVSLLLLIQSVCDLKPLVQWMTLREHYALHESFLALGEFRGTKMKLKDYMRAVGDARNHRFHRVFTFSKSISIGLPEEAIARPVLTLFPLYGKSEQVALEFEDRALVELLAKFTRTREDSLDPSFWARNAEFMARTGDLVLSTDRALKDLWHRKR